LILSTVLNIVGFAIATWTMLPDKLYGFVDNIRYPYHAFICVTLGLVCGLVIGLVTEYYTSKGYRPV
jgi:Na+/H+-translocating membrane pyrophosphatase